MRPAADGDQRSQWRGNTAANQDTVGQLGKHNPPRPAIPESGTRSIAVSTERRLASGSGGRLPIDLVLLQVSGPDETGRYNAGLG